GRTKMVGRPTRELSPWIETYISLRRNSSFSRTGLGASVCIEGRPMELRLLSVRRCVRLVWKGIVDAGFAEPLQAELTGIADAARFRATVVAGPGQGPGHAEAFPFADDVRLRQRHERCADLDHIAFDAAPCAEPGDLLEGPVVLRST